MITGTYPTIENDPERIDFAAHHAKSLGIVDLEPKEMMFYLYLPIKMIDSLIVELPERLNVFGPMVQQAVQDFVATHSAVVYCERYLYITAKRLYVTPDNIGNRPGYHCDGFGTDDINYLWSDSHPTVFNRGIFSVRKDDVLALADMELQAEPQYEYTRPNRSLIRIDSLTPHRTPVIDKPGLRTFVKISISKHRYNLEGNSHNYLFNYDWTLHERGEIRNIENKDFTLDNNTDGSGQ